MTGARNSRAVAAGIIGRWLRTGNFVDRLIGGDSEDRGFIVEVVYGTARWRGLLDWVIASHTRRKPPAIVLPHLYVGIYQLLFLDSVAPHAAVNETVTAARDAAGPRLAGMVNAVLRKVSTDRAALLSRIAGLPLHIRESHPETMVARWLDRFGARETERLCSFNNRRPDIVIRPNLLRASRDSFLARLRKAGVAAEPHPFAPADCLVLPHGARVEQLPGYAEGMFSVQDPSTLAAVHLLDPRPGETVLDLCAAPGGKTALIGELMKNTGCILALDTAEPRVKLLRSNMTRLQLDAVGVCRCNALRQMELDGVCGERMFDRILVDAPCTNTGVLARRPDARWRFSLESLEACKELQARLLDAAAGRLKADGLLVYSTCSMETDENSGLVSAWLGSHPDFRLEKSVSIFPPDTQTDGAFAAALRRSGGA